MPTRYNAAVFHAFRPLLPRFAGYCQLPILRPALAVIRCSASAGFNHWPRWYRRGLAPLLLGALLLLLVVPGWAGLVDFSEGLMTYVVKRWGAEAKPRLLTWQQLVRDTRAGIDAKGDGLALRRANGFFNQVPYITDLKNWGVEDYWATPVEVLGSFGADCEDYAIAKFLSLKEIGVPVGRMRITYVRALNIGESHMVLAYYPTPDADPLILDNLVPEVKPASQRPDLEPVYSFNDEDLWLANGQTSKGGSGQVRLWRELREKLAREQRM